MHKKCQHSLFSIYFVTILLLALHALIIYVASIFFIENKTDIYEFEKKNVRSDIVKRIEKHNNNEKEVVELLYRMLNYDDIENVANTSCGFKSMNKNSIQYKIRLNLLGLMESFFLPDIEDNDVILTIEEINNTFVIYVHDYNLAFIYVKTDKKTIVHVLYNTPKWIAVKENDEWCMYTKHIK